LIGIPESRGMTQHYFFGVGFGKPGRNQLDNFCSGQAKTGDIDTVSNIWILGFSHIYSAFSTCISTAFTVVENVTLSISRGLSEFRQHVTDLQQLISFLYLSLENFRYNYGISYPVYHRQNLTNLLQSTLIFTSSVAFFRQIRLHHGMGCAETAALRGLPAFTKRLLGSGNIHH